MSTVREHIEDIRRKQREAEKEAERAKKVEEFIEMQELKRREEHLISLGLIDESKSSIKIEYTDETDGSKDWQWDNEKHKYYRKIILPVAIKVTDEEYRKIQKVCPYQKKQDYNIEKGNLIKELLIKNIEIAEKVLIAIDKIMTKL